MLAIIHALMGGFIGEEFHSVLFIILASFVLHFIMDMLPHWDANFDRKKFHASGEPPQLSRFAKVWFITDMLIALILIISLYQIFDNKKIILGAFIGILPDLMSLGYKTKLRNNKRYAKFVKFHSKIQGETNWQKSLISQAIIIAIIISLFFIF